MSGEGCGEPGGSPRFHEEGGTSFSRKAGIREREFLLRTSLGKHGFPRDREL